MNACSRFVVVGSLVAGSLCCSTLHAELAWSSLSQSFQPPAGAPTVEADFRFENRGSTPVTIKDVSTSCGCTSTKLDRNTYAPGEGGVLHVIFNTAGRSGRQSKTIRITTDDDKEKPVTLRLDIGLSPSYVVTPRLIRWKREEGAQTKQAFLRLAAGAGFGAPELGEPPAGFKIKLEPEANTAGTFLILVTPENTGATQHGAVAVQLQGPDTEKVSAKLLLVVE